MILTRVGRIDYSGEPPRFVEQIVRTAAGPSMNLLCAVAGYGLLRVLDGQSATLILAVATFARCSLVLAAINFLPAIPFDGGLILRAVLVRWLGEPRAERVAATVSIVLMWGMAALGVATRQFVLTYLGVTMSYDVWRTHLQRPAVAASAVAS
ncbi:MAG TPA: site-2 protease family protein [Kofleriaceae bacterium]|jgi:Zn-dependent protease